MRHLSSLWIPTKLTSSPAFYYSTHASISIPLQLFLVSPSTALFSFLNMYLRYRPIFFPHLNVLCCISASSQGPSKDSPSLLYKAFLRILFIYASPRWFPFLSATNITKSERLHRTESHAITGCLSSSPIPPFPLQGFFTSPTSNSFYSCHFMRRHFVSQSPFSLQAWPDLE